MATLADSLKSATRRPLQLKKRHDLSSRQHRYQGRAYWVVKEPVGLKYFRFHEEEYAILDMLDGRTSLEEIKDRFESRYAPQKITFQDLQHFIGMLHRNGLVVSSSPGQGGQLKRRRDERWKKETMAKFSNVLAIRFKGIDPENLLNAMYPYVRWFFKRATVIFFCLLMLAALLLIAVQFDTFRQKLPAFQEFFGPKNWFLLAVTLGVVKIMHEFGHGLTCKHFGGECHEIGVMLLVLTPCLYCNVSDSWMLPSKWKRAAIGAAGMYVEVVLASIATFVWWFSEPGLLNMVALRVMFICSVSTVLFNGNPLLRYDGYYILADIVEIPNLRQKATMILQRAMSRWCLGLELPEAPFLPDRNHFFFGLYTIASVLYRWFVLISILFFLNMVFEPYGLQVIGQLIAATAIGGLVIKPFWQLYKFLSTPGRIEQVKRLNVFVTTCVVVVIVAGVLLFPIRRRVTCTFEIRPRDAVSVYVDVPGRLDEVRVEPGMRVAQGDLLARLTNVDLRLAVSKLSGQLNEQQARLDGLRQEQFNNPKAHQEIPQVREALEAVRQQLHEKNSDLARLEVRAPAAGTVLPAELRQSRAEVEGMLPEWSGSLLEERNRSVPLTESVKLCEIGDPARLEAQLVIDQTDIELVAAGQEVELMLDAYPGELLEGAIDQIARIDVKFAPRSLSNVAGGDLATRTDASGMPRPLSTSYRANVPLDTSYGALPIGLRGRAKILTGRQPLGGRIWRYLSHTFHFAL